MRQLGWLIICGMVALRALAQPSENLQSLADAIVRNDTSMSQQMIGGMTKLDENIFGATPLHLAAEYGRTDVARMLLDRGVVVDALDSIGRTPLLWAAENRHPEIVQLLLAHGANPNQEDPSRFRGAMDDGPRETPLDYAILAGDRELCRSLLDAGAKVSRNDFARLQRAIESGQPQVLEMLIDKGVSPTAHGKEGGNAFAAAGESKNADMIRILVRKSKGASDVPELLNIALQHAAESGRPAVAQFLLENTKVDVNREVGGDFGGSEILTDSKKKLPGYTALSRAIEQNHDDIVKALLRKGAHVTGRTRACVPILSQVIARGRKDLFALLMRSHPPLNDVGCEGRTALMAATEFGDIEVIATLVKGGAAVAQRDRGGSTALLLASEEGQAAAAEYFLTHGATFTERDNEGLDALMRGAVGGHPGICSLLISKGAKPNSLQVKTGMTALHWAAKNGRAAAVKELLAHGASREIVDKTGKKAVDYARLSGNPECISLLSPSS